MKRLLLPALCAALLLGLRRDASPPALARNRATEFRALMQRLADGLSSGNARQAAECFTEDAVYSEPPDKQLYRGREALFRFFGGEKGRPGAMEMTWHHLAFDEGRQIGFGEFTFEYGGKVHGIVIARIAGGRNRNWREYWYESPLDWDRRTRSEPRLPPLRDSGRTGRCRSRAGGRRRGSNRRPATRRSREPAKGRQASGAGGRARHSPARRHG